MEKITDVRVCECSSSRYIKPYRLLYKQNGVEKIWDYMISHDSIVILLFNSSRDVFILVRQFRPAVYANIAQAHTVGQTVDVSQHAASQGLTFELCAGLMDKDKSHEEMAKAEVLEECGYDVPLDRFEKITSARNGVGTTGSVQTLYYAEVTDDMKVSEGGGLVEEGEMIEVIELPLNSAQTFMWDQNNIKPPGLILAFMWFFQNKRPAVLSKAAESGPKC